MLKYPRLIIAFSLSAPFLSGALAAYAHERWVRHGVLEPVSHEFFRTFNRDMVDIATRVTVILAFLLYLWFLRDALDDIIERGILRRFAGKAQIIVCGFACFITDKAVMHRWFQSIGRGTVLFFMRAPALLLMYAAANRSLIMPSYPLAPETAAVFQFLQVALAIAIVTQVMLPVVGVVFAGIFGYLLFAYDWKIFVDILPVIAVAGIYITVGWDSHRNPVTELSSRHMRWIRVVIGTSFLLLGWMKLYNYPLPIGVVDNYPSVLQDPMIRSLYSGTNPLLLRESWVAAFGLAEVLSGFMIMVGAWGRVWSLVMAYIFTKLLLVDFGWSEIPHLYPVSAFFAIVFSNNHTESFYRIERWEEEEGRRGKTMAQILIALVGAVATAVVVIFPLLYLLTKVPRQW